MSTPHPRRRRLPRALLAALAAVLLAGGPVPAAAGPPVGVADASASLPVFRSRHYLVHTDLPRAEAAPLGRHLDAVHDELAGGAGDGL